MNRTCKEWPLAYETKHKMKAKMAKQSKKSQVAKEVKKVTLGNNDGKKQMKPYCEEAQKLVEQKNKVDALKPDAMEWLKEKLNSDPETANFTGTVVCVFNDQVYKIRIQRPDQTKWRKKTFKDENLKKLKALYKQQDEMKEVISTLEDTLAKDHPKCVEKGFTMAYLSK